MIAGDFSKINVTSAINKLKRVGQINIKNKLNNVVTLLREGGRGWEN